MVREIHSLVSPTRAVNIGGWVDNSTIFIDFEVNMWAGGSTTATHKGNDLPFLDNITDFYEIFLVVTV